MQGRALAASQRLQLPGLTWSRRLASFSRLILFDKRGTGLSDRVPVGELPTLEERMDDVRAVMSAAGCERAALFGMYDGATIAALFAATYPERSSALVTFAKSSAPAFARSSGRMIGSA